MQMPNSGTRCVVSEWHPFLAGRHGIVIATNRRLALLRLDPDCRIDCPAEIALIDPAHLEEEPPCPTC